MPYRFPLPTPDVVGPTTSVSLRVDQPRRFTVERPFWYRFDGALPNIFGETLTDINEPPPGGEGETWVRVPVSKTDLASIPGVLWGLIASYGRHTPSVLLHDHLCNWANKSSGQERFLRRCVADEVFYASLRDSEAHHWRSPRFRSLVLWAGVSLGRYKDHSWLKLAAIVCGVVGAWLPLLWLAQKAPWQPDPVRAGWLWVSGLVVLTVAGILAALWGRKFDPEAGSPGPLTLVGAMLNPRFWRQWLSALAVLGLLLQAAGIALTMRCPVMVSDVWAVRGLSLVILAQVVLSRSPIPRDRTLLLPISIVALPGIMVVGLITYLVLQLFWVPDSASDVRLGPIALVPGYPSPSLEGQTGEGDDPDQLTGLDTVPVHVLVQDENGTLSSVSFDTGSRAREWIYEHRDTSVIAAARVMPSPEHQDAPQLTT